MRTPTLLLALSAALPQLALTAPAPLLPRAPSSSSYDPIPLSARDLLARQDTLTIPGFDSIPDVGVELLYFPGLEAPKAGEVFQAGGVLRVAWNTTKPYDWTNEQLPKTATVRLGYLDPNSPGYHLDVAEPLGEIAYYSGSGSADLPLPANLETRSTYFITAGSTSVTSAQFTIEAVEAAASSSSSPSSTTTSAASTSSPAPVAARPAVQTTTTTSAAREVEFPSPAAAHSSSSTTSRAAAAAVQADSTTLRDIAAPSSSSSSSHSAPSSSSTTPAAASSSSSSAAANAPSSQVSAPSSTSSTPPIAAASGNVAAAAQSPSGTSGAASLSVSAGLAAIVAVAVACAI